MYVDGWTSELIVNISYMSSLSDIYKYVHVFVKATLYYFSLILYSLYHPSVLWRTNMLFASSLSFLFTEWCMEKCVSLQPEVSPVMSRLIITSNPETTNIPIFKVSSSFTLQITSSGVTFWWFIQRETDR